MSLHAIISTVAAVVTAGVIIGLFDWPEAVCAVTGATLLVMSALCQPATHSSASSKVGLALAVPAGNRARAGRDTCARHRIRARNRGVAAVVSLIFVRDEGIQ